MFGEDLVERLVHATNSARPEDLVATVTEFTAFSIYRSYLSFVRRKTMLDELLVSGGGVHNLYLMEALRRYFEGVRVRTTDATNIAVDAKEAICFALLANETIAGHPGNVPGATGARRETILGSICLP